MSDMMFLPIDKGAIPYEFDVELGGVVYTLGVGYNGRFDFFTIDLSQNGTIIVQGEKMVYGQAMFTTVESDALPTVPLTPLDMAGQETRVGYDQLGNTVLLIAGATS